METSTLTPTPFALCSMDTEKLVAKLMGKLSLEVCLGMFVLGPSVACLVATIYARKELLRLRDFSLQPLRRIWKFGQWTYVSDVLGAIRAHVCTLPDLPISLCTNCNCPRGPRLALYLKPLATCKAERTCSITSPLPDAPWDTYAPPALTS